MKWTIKEVKISDLKEYDKNPRKIKKEQLGEPPRVYTRGI